MGGAKFVQDSPNDEAIWLSPFNSQSTKWNRAGVIFHTQGKRDSGWGMQG